MTPELKCATCQRTGLVEPTEVLAPNYGEGDPVWSAVTVCRLCASYLKPDHQLAVQFVAVSYSVLVGPEGVIVRRPDWRKPGRSLFFLRFMVANKLARRAEEQLAILRRQLQQARALGLGEP